MLGNGNWRDRRKSDKVVQQGLIGEHFDGLVQDCSISIANALEILQSCIKPSI